MSYFTRHEATIRDWISLPDKIIQINKTPQVGVTTSLIKVAIQEGLNIAVFEPTNEILDNTVKDAIGLSGFRNISYKKIAPNDEMCPFSEPHPLFEWNGIGSCKECLETDRLSYPRSPKCGYHNILSYPPQVLGVTYAKFNTLNYSYSRFGDAIKNLILRYDIILLDEYSRALLDNSPSVSLSEITTIIKGITNLKNRKQIDAYTYYEQKLEELNKYIEDLSKQKIDTPCKLSNPCCISIYNKKNIRNAIILKDMLSPKNKETFMKYLLVMNSEELVYNIRRVETLFNTKMIDHILIGNTIHPIYKFKEMIEDNNYAGKIFITGMALPHTHILGGRRETMPDYNETQKSRLVVVDKANWDFVNNWKGREENRVKTLITEYLLTNKKILIFAINIKITESIKSWKLSGVDVVAYEDIYHYRHSKSYGVKHEGYDIVLYVGLPHTPLDSQDGNALITNVLYKGNVSASEMRYNEIKETLINALGRAISPEGDRRTTAIVLGTNLDDFKKYYPEKIEVVECLKKDTLQHIGIIIANLWNSGKCKYEDFKYLPEIAETLYKCMLGYYSAHNRINGMTQLQMVNGVCKAPLSTVAKGALRKDRRYLTDLISGRENMFYNWKTDINNIYITNPFGNIPAKDFPVYNLGL